MRPKRVSTCFDKLGFTSEKIVQHALERRRDEQDSPALGHFQLVHLVGRRAQVAQDVGRLGVRVALRLGLHAVVVCDLAKGKRVRLRRDLRAHQLAAGGHEAVQHARLLHVHHVGQQLDSSVVVERLRLVIE